MSPQRKFTIAGSAVYITAVAIAWRITGHIDYVNIILVIGFIWMLGYLDGLHELLEDNRADTDQNGQKLGEITADLTDLDAIRSDLWAIKEDLVGNTTPAGRHGPPAHRKPSPRPRSVA